MTFAFRVPPPYLGDHGAAPHRLTREHGEIHDVDDAASGALEQVHGARLQRRQRPRRRHRGRHLRLRSRFLRPSETNNYNNNITAFNDSTAAILPTVLFIALSLPGRCFWDINNVMRVSVCVSRWVGGIFLDSR